MKTDVVVTVVLYAVVSSLMLVVNSEAVKALHMPATISTSQFVISVLFVFLIQGRYPSMMIDRLVWNKFKHYVPFGVLFGASIFFNMQSLQYTGVGTVIAFRSIMPLGVCVLEVLFLGRQYPSRQSILALTMVFVGVAGYVGQDSSWHASTTGYVWIFLWWTTMAIHMAYGKFVLQNVTLTNKIWGSMLYTNLSGIPIQAICGIGNGEPAKILITNYTIWGVSVFVVSLGFGCAMSYLSWLCMDKVSATQFTLIGVVNKVLTIMADFLINPENANAFAFASLGLCIVSSSFYRQPPMREDENMDYKKAEYGMVSPDSLPIVGKSRLDSVLEEDILAQTFPLSDDEV